MKIQVNSDNTIAVDIRLTRFVKGEVNRVLDRFANRLTRVEIHLSDVDNMKTGKADKRCLVEVRPEGAKPRTASARATRLDSAVGQALRKMQRNLTTAFGRLDDRAKAARNRRKPGATSVAIQEAVPPAAPAKKAPAKKSAGRSK